MAEQFHATAVRIPCGFTPLSGELMLPDRAAAIERCYNVLRLADFLGIVPAHPCSDSARDGASNDGGQWEIGAPRQDRSSWRRRPILISRLRARRMEMGLPDWRVGGRAVEESAPSIEDEQVTR